MLMLAIPDMCPIYILGLYCFLHATIVINLIESFDTFGGNFMFLEIATIYSMAFSLLTIGPVVFGSVEDLIAYCSRWYSC